MKYECSVCGHVYDEDAEGTPWSGLPDDWQCPVCSAEKSYFEAQAEPAVARAEATDATAGAGDGLENYLTEWKRPSDDLEQHFVAIQQMAVTGSSIIEPMRTRSPVVGWDEILVMGAQLAALPLN